MCRAYAEHYESDHTKEFLDQLAKMDVPYTLEVLKHPEVGELVRLALVSWRAGAGGPQAPEEV